MVKKSTYEDLQQRITELELGTEKLRQIEATFIESEHLSKQYFDLPGVIFLSLDKGGNISSINENGLEILGYRQEELLGENWFKICLPHRLQSEILDVFHQLMRGESEPIGYHENLILRKDGSEIVIRWSNTILKNSSGETVGTLSSGEDITERLITEKHLKEAYNIINKSPAVTFLWKNIEGWPVEFVSDNVIAVFGYSAVDFISGRVSYAEVVHPNDLERVGGEVASFSIGKEYERFTHEPYRIVTKDGKVKWLDDQTFIRRNKKGNITHYQGIVLDITDRKQAEVALEKEKLNLKETNIALKVLLRETDITKEELEKSMIVNIKNLLLPYVVELESRLPAEEKLYTEIIKSNMNEITSSFSRKLINIYSKLTPREIQVADFIRQGRTNKEIARLLNITPSAVDFHRRNLRIKFNIRGKKTNLRSQLLSLVG